MKTNHLALAACTALAAAGAFAQSSVTLYGSVDTNYQVLRGEGNGSIRRVNNSGNASSKLGLRGIEDLGGGLSASFHLEGGFNSDVGTGLTVNTNNQPSGAVAAGGFVFNRRSTVSLAGTWGEMRIGRDYVPTYWNLGLFDPFLSLGSGGAINLQAGGGLGTAAQSVIPTVLRASNSIGYFLPDGLGGIYGQAMYALGENASNAAGDTAHDGRYAGARLGYARDRLDAAVAFSETKYSRTTSVGGNYSAANAAVSYRFNFGKLMAQWFRDKIDATTTRAQRGWMLAGSFPVGPGEIKASIVRSDVADSANDGRLLAIGYVHHLSKRTALYTTYGRVDNRGAGILFHNGRPAATPGGTTSGLEFGVRHHF
jgi:predicted porin